MSISQKALDLIVRHEVGGGEVYYNKFLKRPTWPGGASGITIGIGYDCGYNSSTVIRMDWVGLCSSSLNRLASTANITGLRAKSLMPGLKDIEIPWKLAKDVFEERTLPKFIKQTIQAFPGSESLPEDAFGALVSLVFNRGPAIEGDRRREMREIRSIIASGKPDLKAIANQIRSMKRLWVGKGLDGLLHRRNEEADLVEQAV